MESIDRYVASSSSPSLTNPSLADHATATVLAYKKVAKKVHPVATSLPEDFRITRRRPEDPLLTLPTLPACPPPFTPGDRLTQERFEGLDLDQYSFLWPEEVKLAAHVLRANEKVLTWTEGERG
jgi:hypothetical protein